MIEPHTQRAMIQLILAVVFITWGAAMWLRAWRNRDANWPPPWEGIIGPLLFVVGVWFLSHAVFWILYHTQSQRRGLDHWSFLVNGWLAVIIAVPAYIYWLVKDDGESDA
jgi:hypothetical protein